MFKNKVFFISIICLLFIACSNSPDSQLVMIEEDTLKSIITNKEQNVLWTSELEGDVLSKNISDFDFLVSGVKGNLNLLKVMGSDNEAIFPEIKGFASLDFRNVPLVLKDFLISFGDSLCNEDALLAEKYFDSSYIFTYVFFRHEMEEAGIKNFSHYIIGRPYFFQDSLKVPFRFYYDKVYSDVFVCLKKSVDYKVYNLYFIKEDLPDVGR